MTPVDAVTILAQCRDLADKLLTQGADCHLDAAELDRLLQFRKVKEAGYVGNYDVRRLAGLSVKQAEALDKALKANRVKNK